MPENNGKPLLNLSNLFIWLVMALLGVVEAYHQLEVSANHDAHIALQQQVTAVRDALALHMQQDRETFAAQQKEDGALEERAAANRRDIERHEDLLQAEQLEWARSGHIVRPRR